MGYVWLYPVARSLSNHNELEGCCFHDSIKDRQLGVEGHMPGVWQEITLSWHIAWGSERVLSCIGSLFAAYYHCRWSRDSKRHETRLVTKASTIKESVGTLMGVLVVHNLDRF